MPPSVTRETAQPPLQAMEPWEISLWEAHIGTWTSTYTVRDASGALLDEYEAVNEINLDLATNTYAQRNTYTRTKNGERSVETRSYTAYWEYVSLPKHLTQIRTSHTHPSRPFDDRHSKALPRPCQPHIGLLID